ncbi:MAG: cytochrome c maturation protein CcmE [Fimbriimonas sp.]
MKSGPIVTAVVAFVAMGGVVVAFMSNASPYVTIAEARQMRSDRMHLAGDILKETVVTDIKSSELRFQVKDSKGEQILIVHRGEIPANMGSATKVVAIGGIEGDRFMSKQLLLKCPSRYEEEKKKGTVARN